MFSLKKYTLKNNHKKKKGKTKRKKKRQYQKTKRQNKYNNRIGGSQVSEHPKLNLGIFIAGYKGKEPKYLDSIQQWEKVFDKVKIFTDSRLDDNARVWLDHEAIDLSTKEIAILDWYVVASREFLNDAKYITFYSDLCRWYIIKILNEEYSNDINGFCQASYLYVQEEGKLPVELKTQLKDESMSHFVIYGNDRNFMLDGQIEFRKSGQNVLNRICFGLDCCHNLLFSKDYFRSTSVGEIVKASVENPNFDEDQIFESWKEKSLLINIKETEEQKLEKKRDFFVFMPQEFAGLSFRIFFNDKIKSISPDIKFAPFFKRMEKEERTHWTYEEPSIIIPINNINNKLIKINKN